MPRKEVEAFTDQIKGRDFDMLFDSFEAYDVQETRRVSKAEGKIECILDLLNDIGTVPDNLKDQIQSQTDLDVLKALHKLAAKSNSIEEFQAKAKL